MKHASILIAAAVTACTNEPQNRSSVAVLRVAPPQLVEDSLEITPRLATARDAPERGAVALSIELHVRNASGVAKAVPRIGFRAVPESARDTAVKAWEYLIGRRSVDTLGAGESASFGVTTSPATLAAGATVDGVYRVEAVFGDSTMARRALPLGRVRVITRPDSS